MIYRPRPIPPLRLTCRPQRIALPTYRGFRTLPAYCAEESTHYETLGVSENASQADIKQQFYALSKTHHPDHNPNDPTASARFVKISEAYHVVGFPEKRSQYDRDLARSSPSPSPFSRSHSSHTTHAGSRPASGLSRRKTQFRGPPPSFYRSGGWGSQSAKRSANAAGSASAQGDTSTGYSAAGSSGVFSEASTQGGAFGYGPGYTTGFDNDVPHFDQPGHLRTQQGVESYHRRVRSRRADGSLRDLVPGEGTGGTMFSFFLVSGIVLLAMTAPAFFAFSDPRVRTRREAS